MNESQKRGNTERSGDVVGRGVNRVDGRLKVTGGARYSADYPIEKLTYAALIESKIANGKIVSVDRSSAERVPGVIAVLTHENGPKLHVADGPAADVATAQRRFALQNSEVNYNMQHIGVVVADTIEAAKQAASLVQFQYEEQPQATNMDRERAKAVVPRGRIAGKPADVTRGSVDDGLRNSEIKVDEIYRTPTENHNPMEPHATTAVWEGDKLTVYDATQYTYGARHSLAVALGIPEENVRVISKFVGGAFGCKGTVWSHVTLTAAVARQIGRPVKLVLSRDQMFSTVGHRAETEQHVVLGARKDGQLTLIIHEGISHTSSFDEFVEPFSKPTHMMYSSANLKTSQRLIRLNVGTPTFMRAPGEASGMFALESALDELAYKVNLDPIQLRLKNFAESDPDTKLPWSTNSLRECLRVGAEKFGWSRRSPVPRSMKDGNRLVGYGMASCVYPVNHIPSSARVRIKADGTAIAESSSHELGTGIYTILTQIAADALGIVPEQITMLLGDTNLPRAGVSGGSSSTMSVGSSVQGASKAAREKVVQMAIGDRRSQLFGASADQVDARNGRLISKTDSSKIDTYAAVLSRAQMKEIEASFDTEFSQKKEYSSHSFGAMFAEVKVDPDFGEVRVSRVTGAYGIGRVMNEKTARSQMQGGIVMGVGMALTEETIMDPVFGRIVNHDLAEYHVPVNADIPDIEIAFIDEFDPHASPIGAKGAGEIGIVGAAAAIANAVYHATGVRVRDLPITPDKVMNLTGRVV